MINPTVPPHEHDNDVPPAPPLPTVDELAQKCPTFSRLDAAIALTVVQMRESNPYGRSIHIANVIEYSLEGYTWMQIWMVMMTEWVYQEVTDDCEFILEYSSLAYAVRHRLPPMDAE
jgi:hypothetical protein